MCEFYWHNGLKVMIEGKEKEKILIILIFSRSLPKGGKIVKGYDVK